MTFNKMSRHQLLLDLLTQQSKKLWTTFETSDIYRFLTEEEDTYPEFQYNWTTVPKLQPLGPTHTFVSAAPPAAPPAPAPSPATQPDSPNPNPENSFTLFKPTGLIILIILRKRYYLFIFVAYFEIEFVWNVLPGLL